MHSFYLFAAILSGKRIQELRIKDPHRNFVLKSECASRKSSITHARSFFLHFQLLSLWLLCTTDWPSCQTWACSVHVTHIQVQQSWELNLSTVFRPLLPPGALICKIAHFYFVLCRATLSHRRSLAASLLFCVLLKPSLWIKGCLLFQGPPGPPGAQGNPGPPGEGFPGPKVSHGFHHLLDKGLLLNNVVQ